MRELSAHNYALYLAVLLGSAEKYLELRSLEKSLGLDERTR